MTERENKQKSTSSLKGATIALVTAIVLLSIILIYLCGILFLPPFADWALDAPGISAVTKALVGDLYKENDLDLKENDVVVASSADADTNKDTSDEYVTKLPYSGEQDSEYLNHCMFLGDSRTVAMVNYGYVPEDSTLAQVGLSHVDARTNVYNQTTTGLQYTWDTYLETHKAEVIYISYGINGLSYTDEDTYKQSYEDLVDDVIQQCPDSKIVLQSIWPVREGYAATSGILNSKVDYYNEFLYALAEEKGIYYLDTESVLKDDEGAMNTLYNSGDGLHYNESAYEVIFSYLLSHTVPQIED